MKAGAKTIAERERLRLCKLAKGGAYRISVADATQAIERAIAAERRRICKLVVDVLTAEHQRWRETRQLRSQQRAAAQDSTLWYSDREHEAAEHALEDNIKAVMRAMRRM